MKARFPRLLLPLLIAAAIAPHLTGLGNRFVFDDKGLIVENRAVTGTDLGAIWSGPYWPDRPIAGLYRPITSTTYAIDWALWGGSPTGFVVTNILIHAAATLAALWLLRRLFPLQRSLAWAAAFLFAVHPIHVEVAVGIVGRAESLAALFALLAYASWLGAERGRNPLLQLLPPFLWIGALLSKESAIALPALLIAHRMRLLPPVSSKRRLRAADCLWPAALAAVVGLRLLALGRFDTPAVTRIDNPLAHVGLIERLLGAGGVLARQLIQLSSSRGFSADYSYAQVEPAAPLYATGAIVLLLLATAGLASLRWGRSSPLGWGFAFFFLFWLPTSNLLVPIGTVQADRLLYLPLLGLLVVAVAAFLRIPSRLTRGQLGLGLLVLLVLRSAVGSAIRATEWKDDSTLFEAAVREAPKSLKARANLAAVLLRDESAATAREVLLLIEPVREFGEGFGPLTQREAKARMFLGEHESARTLYREALRTGADSAVVLIELGNLALMADDGGEALEAFRAVERTGGKPLHAAIGRASALSILGRFAESARVWGPIVQALPDSVPVRTACAWNLREAGRYAESDALLRDGLRRGEDARLWDALARSLLMQSGSEREALDAAQRAVAIAPTEEHRTSLALAFLKTGDRNEALRIRNRLNDPDLVEEVDEALSAGAGSRN